MKTITTRTIIGLLQGIILASIIYASETLSVDLHIFFPALLVTLFVPTLTIQSLGSMRLKTRRKWEIGVALILVVVGYYAIARQPLPLPLPHEFKYEEILPRLLPITAIALFIAHSLVVSGGSDEKFIASYLTYYNTAWKLGLQAIVAAAFLGAFWLLLLLGSGLFKIIHLDFFEKLITHRWFAWPASTLAVAVALHVTDIKVGLILGLRSMILVLLSWLLPIIVVILSAFLLSLIWTGPTLLWQTGHASTLLVVAALALIVLINATYQDGLTPMHALQRYSTWLACALITPMIALAIYALSLRVGQYGWSVTRIYAATVMFIIAAYAVGYAIALVRDRMNLKFIQTSNVITSWLMLAAFLALYTPIADPARIMVSSQLARLYDGKVTPQQFDFAGLRYQGLRFGQDALQTLQTNWQGPSAEFVKKQAKEALALKQNTSPINRESASVETKKQLIIVHTKDAQLPESFVNQIWGWSDGGVPLPNCLNNGLKKCDAWIVSAQEASPLIILLADQGFIGFKQASEGRWNAIGTWPIPPACNDKKQLAAKGQFELVAPSPMQPDIDIGGWHTHFEANRYIDKCQ